MSTNSWEMMRVILKMKQHTKSVLILMNLRVRVQLAVIYLWLVQLQYEIRQSWQQVIEQIVTFLIHSGVYILSSNLKNFPPPCIFNLISFPKEKKARSDFCLFWGLKGGLPPCQNFFLGNLSIILAFSEQLFHNFPSLPLLSNLPHLIFFPNTPTTW